MSSTSLDQTYTIARDCLGSVIVLTNLAEARIFRGFDTLLGQCREHFNSLRKSFAQLERRYPQSRRELVGLWKELPRKAPVTTRLVQENLAFETTYTLTKHTLRAFSFLDNDPCTQEDLENHLQANCYNLDSTELSDVRLALESEHMDVIGILGKHDPGLVNTKASNGKVKFTVQNLADYLTVDGKTARTWLSGKLKAIDVGSGLWELDQAELKLHKEAQENGRKRREKTKAP